MGSARRSDASGFEYHLTVKGRQLQIILLALWQWGGSLFFDRLGAEVAFGAAVGMLVDASPQLIIRVAQCYYDADDSGTRRVEKWMA